MTKFTPDLNGEHPESKKRALYDLSSQQWLIALIVYNMSAGASKTMSMQTVYAEARKFNAGVVGQCGRSFNAKPRKRQKVSMVDLDDSGYSSFEDSWNGLMDKNILAPWLPVYRNLDPEGVEPINPMRGQPDTVQIDSSGGFERDPAPLGRWEQVIRGLTEGTFMVIRNLYDDFQAKREGRFGPNPFASL